MPRVGRHVDALSEALGEARRAHALEGALPVLPALLTCRTPSASPAIFGIAQERLAAVEGVAVTVAGSDIALEMTTLAIETPVVTIRRECSAARVGGAAVVTRPAVAVVTFRREALDRRTSEDRLPARNLGPGTAAHRKSDLWIIHARLGRIRTDVATSAAAVVVERLGLATVAGDAVAIETFERVTVEDAASIRALEGLSGLQHPAGARRPHAPQFSRSVFRFTSQRKREVGHVVCPSGHLSVGQYAVSSSALSPPSPAPASDVDTRGGGGCSMISPIARGVVVHAANALTKIAPDTATLGKKARFKGHLDTTCGPVRGERKTASEPRTRRSVDALRLDAPRSRAR